MKEVCDDCAVLEENKCPGAKNITNHNSKPWLILFPLNELQSIVIEQSIHQRI